MAKISKDIDFSQHKSNLIPISYIEFIFRHCPRAGELYCLLWKSKDKNQRIILLKNEISSRTLMHKHAFNSSLRMLCREGLASIDESPNMITIELVGWDDGDTT
jgi:hypothetical protein